MERKEAIYILENGLNIHGNWSKALEMAIASLKTDEAYQLEYENRDAVDVIRCRDCKWWRDSDGEYRRGCGAESKCPINRREVFEGNGYCYLYEPQKSEDKE
jgi:hypothetical protein